jgi:DNA-binding CsgD family transcriptional regulator
VTADVFNGLGARAPLEPMRNPLYVDRGHAGATRKAEKRYPNVPNKWDLSPAQYAVLKAFIENDFTSVGASQALFMSEKTASNHLTRAKEKMGALNTLHAVVLFDREWQRQEGARQWGT